MFHLQSLFSVSVTEFVSMSGTFNKSAEGIEESVSYSMCRKFNLVSELCAVVSFAHHR